VLVGGSALGIWAERAGGAYLGPPFLCPPWLSTSGITYASLWAFGPAYAIFGVLMVLVGLVDPEDVVVVRGCLSPPVMWHLYGWWFLASERGYQQGTYFGCRQR